VALCDARRSRRTDSSRSHVDDHDHEAQTLVPVELGRVVSGVEVGRASRTTKCPGTPLIG
jgi:hypothetical protein